ncbi:hypothetical protein HAX54_020161 [Datura stramonium]|uniref:Uncharacterized protein n=1 Tax=Datura stramonium TaxID=4076 RepID=A0ABS8Y3W0_DATST|nr:hypothetical protein [Datura stramonium]
MHNIKIRRLLNENKRPVEERIILQHELGVLREEIYRVNVMVADIQARHEIHSSKLMKRGLKMIEEISAIELLQNDVKHLYTKVMRLCTIKHDLSSQVETLSTWLE